MPTSLNNHSSFTRPRTSDREGRPGTRDQGADNLLIPSRTSSLHSRITQPAPATLNVKTQQRAPKTLTHAYMVCGVGREPSQWVKAPAPPQGKISHMKGAVGQFWLPEILGSSPRLEQDNDIARALHAAMRVSQTLPTLFPPGALANPCPGMLPSRRGDLHWSQPATLRSPCFCSPTRLFTYSVRYIPTCLVACR